MNYIVSNTLCRDANSICSVGTRCFLRSRSNARLLLSQPIAASASATVELYPASPRFNLDHINEVQFNSI